ncbi:MAG: class I SAM-dependent methyltransferase [Roseiflexaceae bacterium]
MSEPGDDLADPELPDYACMLHAYHRARAADLRAIIATLPLAPGDRVLDVPCGDGCYSLWLAERAGQIAGIDLSSAYLAHARHRAARTPYGGRVSFLRADVGDLPFDDSSFDLTWCVQSLFSLPDPLVVLREMIRVTRPDGHIAILENDTLHQLLLPWPAELELAVRQAQMAALAARHPAGGLDKCYIGRNLCGLFHQCGVEACAIRTFSIDIRAPLSVDEELFLRLYFADLRACVWPYLDSASRAAFDMLFAPLAPTYLLCRPDFHITHLEMLAVGRKQ